MGIHGGAPDLSVVPADVANLGKYAYDLADILSNALTTAGRSIDTVTSTSWQSPAAESFSAGWNTCYDGGQKIITALAEMAEKLGVTAETYGSQDNQFAAEVSSLNLPPIGGPRMASPSSVTTSSLELPGL